MTETRGQNEDVDSIKMRTWTRTRTRKKTRTNVLSMGVVWDSWGELGQAGRIGTPFLSSIRRDIMFVFGIVPIPSACPKSPCLSQFTPVDSNS